MGENCLKKTANLISERKFKEAQDVIRGVLAQNAFKDFEEEVEYRILLINSLVLASEHTMAIKEAKILAKKINLPTKFPTILVFLIRYLFILPGLDRLGSIFLNYWYLAPMKKLLSKHLHWKTVRAIQFAFYWKSIKSSAVFSLMQISLSTDALSILRSKAWLYYSISYSTGSKVGRILFEKLVENPIIRSNESELRELLPLLGILEFQARNYRKSLEVLKQVDALLQEQQAFFKLITIMISVCCKFELRDYEGFERDLDKAFRYSAPMQRSRYYIQFYEYLAILNNLGERFDKYQEYQAKSSELVNEFPNTLDWLIYYRLKCLSPRAGESIVTQIEEIKRFENLLFEYGVTHFEGYAFLRKLLYLIRSKEVGFKQKVSLVGLFIRSTFKVMLWSSDYWLIRDLFLIPLPFSALKDKAEYFKYKYLKERNDSKETKIEKLTERQFHTLTFDYSEQSWENKSANEIVGFLEDTLEARKVSLENADNPENFRIFEDKPYTSVDYFKEGNQFNWVTGKVDSAFLVYRLSDRFVLDYKYIVCEFDDVNMGTYGLFEAAVKFAVLQVDSALNTLIARDKARKEELHKLKLEQEKREYQAVANAVRYLAHDVQKPLSIVQVSLSMLRKCKEPAQFESMYRTLLNRIREADSTTKHMIRQLLDFKGTYSLQKEATSITCLLKRALIETSDYIRLPKIQVHCDFQHSLLLDGDQKYLQRAFANILTNACQVTGANGNIWIKTKQQKQRVVLEIRNDGSFIPEELVEQIFEPNFTHNKKQGSGLGLAMVKKIIQSHEGQISVQNDVMNKEVGFLIELGCLDYKDPSVPIQSGRLSSFTSVDSRDFKVQKLIPFKVNTKFKETEKKLSIGLLDDEPEYIKNLIQELEESGFTKYFDFHQFSCPDDMLALNAAQFDFCFLDIHLNHILTGIEVSKKLKESRNNLPIAMVSNAILDSNLDSNGEFSFYATFGKPLSANKFISFVEQKLN